MKHGAIECGTSAEGEATANPSRSWSAARDEPRRRSVAFVAGPVFDVIAELKLRSPAAGALGDAADDWLGRVAAYARRRRGGCIGADRTVTLSMAPLEHLRQASQVLAPLGVPAMRKDFLSTLIRSWKRAQREPAACWSFCECWG